MISFDVIGFKNNQPFLNSLSDLDFDYINEIDLDFVPKNLCAQFS